jgi:hypothetical protein
MKQWQDDLRRLKPLLKLPAPNCFVSEQYLKPSLASHQPFDHSQHGQGLAPL